MLWGLGKVASSTDELDVLVTYPLSPLDSGVSYDSGWYDGWDSAAEA